MYRFKTILCESNEASRHGAAWRLLLSMIAEEYGYTLTEADFERNENGKPYCRTYPELYVSIAHTKCRAMAVLSDKPIGIDCEYVRHISNRVRKRMLAGFAGSDREATVLWTMLESRVKLDGTTLWKPGFAYESIASPEYVFTQEQIEEDNALIVTVCRKQSETEG